MTVELAEIHVEDVKSGYILHHPTLGPVEVVEDGWLYRSSTDGGRHYVDLLLQMPGGSRVWRAYEEGTVVEVEA